MVRTVSSTHWSSAAIGGRKAETPQLWKQQSTTQLVDRGRASGLREIRNVDSEQGEILKMDYSESDTTLKWAKQSPRPKGH